MQLCECRCKPRSIINSLRSLLPQKDRANHVWLGYLRRPRPILTRVVEDLWGDAQVVVEPDRLDETNADPRAATLWTDFMLDGDPKKSGEIARRNISDFQAIAVEYELGVYRGVLPEELIARHTRCLNAIEFYRTDRMVVVTHFLPLRESIHPQFAGSALNAYFCSDCSHTVDKVARRDPRGLHPSWLRSPREPQVRSPLLCRGLT